MNADKLAQILRKAIPYLREEGAKYTDDGSNEPLELAREAEELLAEHDAQPAQAAQPVGVPDIDAMVDRFLAWPLPASVACDLCCAQEDENPHRTGTNLLTSDEARSMFEYALTTSQQPHSSIAGLSEGGLVRGVGDVDKGVPVSASGAQKEAPVVADVGINSAEHDLKTTVLAGPHGGKSTPYVPEGWVLVPREPTQQMLAAEDGAVPPKEDGDDGGDPFAWGRVSWTTMLAAAPQPPAQPSADAEDAKNYRWLIRQPWETWKSIGWTLNETPALRSLGRKDAINAARAAEGGE